MSTQHLSSVPRSRPPRPSSQLPATWPRGLGDLVPQRAATALLQVDHMPLTARIGYFGLLAITGVTLIFLLPGFLIHLTGLHTISRMAGAVPGLIGLLAIMLSIALTVLQVALVLKVPERLEWVRFLLTALLAVSAVEAVLRSWAYPSVLSMGLRWDLGIMAFMVLLLWLPPSQRWFAAPDRP
ncbi:hypothetical protein [Nesterenkonia suensis]